MALKVGEGLTPGSSRPTTTIKCGNTVSSVATNGWMSHQTMEESGGSFGFPEFKSKCFSCSLYTLLQGTESGKIFKGVGQPGLCSLNPHITDC